MKKLAVGMLFVLTIAGCESGELSQKNEQLTKQVTELEQQLRSRTGELHQQNETMNRLSEEARQAKQTVQQQDAVINKLRVTEDRVRRITESRELAYTVLAAEAGNNRNEKVIYVKGLTDLKEKETFLLKAAVLFAHEREVILTFWDDERLARQYSSGDFDAEETLFGWSGFDSRFGRIDTTRTPAGLQLYLSGHDSDNLEFGHYGITP
jgi:outer membrane murein-binding lipoprotein Lpp